MKSKLIKNIKRQVKGITLIALVVTIIVLLILAGVAITLTVGDNGLFIRAEIASKEYTIAEIQEELTFAIQDVIMDAIEKGQSATIDDMVNALEKIGADATDIGGIIEGEYKNHGFTIDENNNITVGDKLTGAKPVGTFTLLTEDPDLDEVDFQITATTTEGDIESIIPLNDGIIQKTENSVSDKIYTVSQNGKYKFKITGTNKRITIFETDEITNTIETIEAESMFDGISKANSGGTKKIKVRVGDSQEIYRVNIIRVEGNLVLDGTDKGITGITRSENTYAVGLESDIGTTEAGEAGYAKNTAVLKVEGDLTINQNITLTSLTATGKIGSTKRTSNLFYWKNNKFRYNKWNRKGSKSIRPKCIFNSH